MDRDLTASARGRRRIAPWLGVAVLVAVTLSGGRSTSLAAFSEVTTAPVAATVQVLDPPSNVTCAATLVICTGGLISRPQLSWTPTPDAFATGYEVWRSTTNGSGYVLVATAAGRTTTTWTDNGTLSALTTYFYVVRSLSPGWTSAYSNQVAVTIAIGG